MKSNPHNIVALFGKPIYHIDCNWLVWEGYRFNTQIQNNCENFMYQVFKSCTDYFFIYESDLKKSKKYPHNFQYKYNVTDRWVDVSLTDVYVEQGTGKNHRNFIIKH